MAQVNREDGLGHLMMLDVFDDVVRDVMTDPRVRASFKAAMERMGWRSSSAPSPADLRRAWRAIRFNRFLGKPLSQCPCG